MNEKWKIANLEMIEENKLTLSGAWWSICSTSFVFDSSKNNEYNDTGNVRRGMHRDQHSFISGIRVPSRYEKHTIWF